MIRSPEEQWVHWWCNPWDWAHPDWTARFAARSGASVEDCQGVMNSRHSAFLHSVGIASAQPPEPSENLLRWLSLLPEQRDQALSLARRICLAHLDSPALPTSPLHADEPWCRSLAKALRPGQWLDAQSTDPRHLLGAWLGDSYWPRLRLHWSPQEVERLGEASTALPGHKLQTLWQAIVWRVTAV